MFQHKSGIAMVILLGLASWTWGDAGKSAPEGKPSHQWIPVEQDAWATFLEAPEYHFAKARESLANNDARTAAGEIRKGALLLSFQAKRLEASVNDLYTLANRVKAGKVKAGPEMDAVLARADKTLDYREPLVPVANGEDELFVESGRYHVDQAEAKLAGKDHNGAAAEFRKAISYLKLQAIRSRGEARADLQSALGEMEALAKKVESGTDVAANDLDKSFAKARSTLTGHKD